MIISHQLVYQLRMSAYISAMEHLNGGDRTISLLPLELDWDLRYTVQGVHASETCSGPN